MIMLLARISHRRLMVNVLLYAAISSSPRVIAGLPGLWFESRAI
jgi:hypothetical protein